MFGLEMTTQGGVACRQLAKRGSNWAPRRMNWS